jgi:hypothetical protein
MNRKAVIQAGRGVLLEWLSRAEAHGTIYATVPGPPRTLARFNLYTIITKPRGPGFSRVDSPELVKLWPTLPLNVEGCEIDVGADSSDYTKAVDLIARDWGFSFERRCFVNNGGGMDMLFDLVDRISVTAGIRGAGSKVYAHRVKLESIQ